MQQTDTILRTDKFGRGTCNITGDAFSYGSFPCRSFRNDFIQNIFEQKMQVKKKRKMKSLCPRLDGTKIALGRQENRHFQK